MNHIRKSLSYVRLGLILGCVVSLMVLVTNQSIQTPYLSTIQNQLLGSPVNQGFGSNYVLQRNTWGSAGTNATSATYRLRGTFGQESIGNGNTSTNSSYRLQSGFWAGLSVTNGGTPTPTPTGTIPTATPTSIAGTPTPTPTGPIPTASPTPISGTPTPTPTGPIPTATPTPTTAVFTPTPTSPPNGTEALHLPLVLRLVPTPLPPTVTPTPTVALPTCESVDREPNDAFLDAQNNLPLCEGVSLTGGVTVNDVNDIYRIELGAGQTNLQIDLTNLPSGADYDLYLYDSRGGNGQVAVSNSPGSVNEQIRVPVSGGRYFIRIVSLQYAAPNTYQLRWSRN